MGGCLEQWRGARWAVRISVFEREHVLNSSCALSGLMLHFPFLVLNSPSPLLLTTSVTLFLGPGILHSPARKIRTHARSQCHSGDGLPGHRPITDFQISVHGLCFLASNSSPSMGIRALPGQLSTNDCSVFGFESGDSAQCYFTVTGHNPLLYHVGDVPRDLREMHRVSRPQNRRYDSPHGVNGA
ncbi:hypothetical protein DFH07DRAFT_4128 [Mycena maculata]|uniref:Uncharacterized protein n=1 Tax=Mycena maculata TaxID=230809 RepID=A0AAD7KGU2_9AGAR|nr:hypothetical protein DFH07DRAFT_4128 [Mycena maculata]